MPPWLVVLVVIGAMVALWVLLAIRRPSSIDDELRRRPRPAGFAKRAAGRASLVEVLKALASERATGRLDVTSGSDKCSLSFLFGHLFHAASGELKGEDALHAALAWPDPSWTFDSKSRLSLEETIVGDPISTL